MGSSDPLAEALKDRAKAEGFELAGIGSATPLQTVPALEGWLAQGRHGTMDWMARSLDLRRSLDSVLPGARSYLAVGQFYGRFEDPAGQAKVALYARGRDYHKVLRGKLRALGRWLEAQTPTRWRACVDSAPTMDRELAWRAGLGWFGKNTCLIDSRRGSAFVIGLLVTDLDLPPDAPAQGGCGSCRLCIEACPTGAIVHSEGRWQVDSRTCISYKTIEHRGPVAGLHGWTFGCDVCQAVCPFNQPRASQPLRAPDVDPFGRKPWPSEPVLAAMDEPAWDALTQGTAVRRPGYGGLRRNAQTVLTESREPENSG